MRLHSLELSGFKSFARKTTLSFRAPITAIVGPNGSGKSNTAESFRFALGEQSIKSLRGKRGEDLIWNGSADIPRSGRASVVLTFDNTSRVLALDLDTVTIERVVHRDGINEYALNGSRVRLKDIAGLLAQANIGASGHHIISQGEADRVLICSSRERRAMIEDALGLRIYHYKLAESVRKLAQTKENIRSVEALRREIAPHLKFLKKQSARLERARSFARDLVALYRVYFASERVWIKAEGEQLQAARMELTLENEALREEREAISSISSAEERSFIENASNAEGCEIEATLRELRRERERQSRELGRIEGMLEMLRASEVEDYTRGADFVEPIAEVRSPGLVPFGEMEELAALVDTHLEGLEGEEDLGTLRAALIRLRQHIALFVAERRAGQRVREASTSLSIDERERLISERERVVRAISILDERERSLTQNLREFEEASRLSREHSYEHDRSLAALEARMLTLAREKRELEEREAELARATEDFKRDQGEAALLLGREVLEDDESALRDREAPLVESSDAARVEREGIRRDIERLRIRLEEAGSAESIEAEKEYQATTERDQYLERELSDLALSEQSLRTLMETLGLELETRFRDGLEKINAQFQEFFSLLFDGGRAAVVMSIPHGRRGRSDVVHGATGRNSSLGDGAHEGDEEENENEDGEIGLDVEVSLPRKRVKGLEQLSGGERALTSTALIFAISQVHPPPFLILDETDAALDESNSRRYGDMIERLAERSQLIVITHNRETMSRAGELYGVTMASDGVSQLLSVRLEEVTAAVT